MINSKDDYSDYISGSGHNSGGEMAELTSLIEQQHAIEQQMNELELEMQGLKTRHRHVSENAIPEAMESLGMTMFRTVSGISAEVAETVRASISAGNKTRAFAYMNENGYGALIKRKVVTEFGLNSEKESAALTDRLRAEGHLTQYEMKVEPSTLTSFVKEQLAEGKNIPQDAFGVMRQRVAKITINN